MGRDAPTARLSLSQPSGVATILRQDYNRMIVYITGNEVIVRNYHVYIEGENLRWCLANKFERYECIFPLW